MAAQPGPDFRWGVVLRKSKLNADGMEESTDRQEMELVYHIRQKNMGVIVQAYLFWVHWKRWEAGCSLCGMSWTPPTTTPSAIPNCVCTSWSRVQSERPEEPRSVTSW